MNPVVARAIQAGDSMQPSAGYEPGPGPGPEPIANDVPDPTSSAGPSGQLQNALSGPPPLGAVEDDDDDDDDDDDNDNDDDDDNDGSILIEDYSPADGTETSSVDPPVNGIDTSLSTDELQSDESASCEEPGQLHHAKHCLHILKKMLTGDLPATTMREYLELLYQHSSNCDEEACDVPLCFVLRLFDRREFRRTVARIRRATGSDLCGEWTCLQYFKKTTILLCDDDYSFGSNNPLLDFLPLVADHFESNTRITAVGTLSIVPPERVKFEQYHSLLDEADREVWRKMRELSPASRTVIAHYIFVEKSNYGSVITSARLWYMNEVSLERMLVKLHGGFAMQQVWNIADNLTAAMMHLRQAGVLFLRWTVDSVIWANGHYKLCDFTCAVALSSIQDDEENIEIVRRRLPGYIIPPEMFSYEVDDRSEIWGLGCLIYHMITGRHLHYDRTNNHQTSNDMFEMMRDFYSDEENIARMRVGCHELLQQVFTVRPERIELQQVITYVKEQL